MEGLTGGSENQGEYTRSPSSVPHRVFMQVHTCSSALLAQAHDYFIIAAVALQLERHPDRSDARA